ncbi:major histocompatibility complex class I-related gene protein-like isoform X2 [Megalobrama amblycephala]|uniref:major histocompatibility complex class I-related gene protein-like isoform X2 n=1 Tax=Megalobrama amblycephala TaxID=75352 RepID=UPI00201402E9|nr:major histocompatibility complex class I-related gene protein-like isoform X2 [Megalobrama amblycephala]
MKFIIFFIYIPFVYSELHSFMTTYTGIRGQTIAGIPEFSAVTTLDDQQIDYYDSITMELIPKQDWMKEFASKDMWKEDNDIRQYVQLVYKNNIDVLMQRFNQSHGVHTYQRVYGCVWDDKTEVSQGFDLYAYDGKDFISLGVKERRYTESVPQASPTVQKWSDNKAQLGHLKLYYEHECVYWLIYFLKLRKAGFKRRAPEVSLLQKHPSSPVECYATDFYPSGVTITWLKNGVDHNEDVEHGDTLINEDGTFQKSATLYAPLDDWMTNQYVCEVEHMTETIRKILTDNEIKSNNRPTKGYFKPIFCMMGVLIVLVIGAVVWIIKKKVKTSGWV